MKKLIFILNFIVYFIPLSIFALDPVAPKSDRSSGFFKIDTPQSTDSCEMLRLNPSTPIYKTNCKPNEMMTVPVGEYQVSVRMQEYSWTKVVNVYPTEYTSIAVLSYGNLLVSTPRSHDKIEVYNTQGTLVTEFKANTVKTVPTGSYEVKVQSKDVSTSMKDVSVIADKTRELVVTYK